MNIIEFCKKKIFPNKKIEDSLTSRGESQDLIIDKFFGNESVQQLSTNEASSRFYQLISVATEGNIPTGENKILTVKQLQYLDKAVDKHLKNMTKKVGFFDRWLYIGTEVTKNHPEVHRELLKMLKSNETKSVSELEYGSLFGQTLEHMRFAAEGEGFNIMNKFRARPKSLNKLLKMQNKYLNILQGKEKYDGETGPIAAERYKIQDGKGPDGYKKSLEFYTKQGEGKVYQDFMDLVLMSDVEFDRLPAPTGRNRAQQDAVRAAATIWRKKILPQSNNRMINSWKNFINILEGLGARDKETPEYKQLLSFSKEQLKTFQTYSKSETGLFPIATLDIMPTLEANLVKILSPRKGSNDFADGAKSIVALKDVIQSNIYKKHNLGNEAVVKNSGDMNYNYLGLLDSYVNSTTKLEHSLTNTGAMLNVMKFVTNTKNRGKMSGDGKATSFDQVNAGLQDYMQNTYLYQMGVKDLNAVTGEPTIYAKMARMATSVQFFSKLGYNLRSAARNSAQALFHYVHFGVAGVNRLNKELKQDKDLQTRVNMGLEKSGLKMEFGETANIREVYGQLTPERVFDPTTGTYKAKVDFSMLDKLDSLIDAASTKSGVFMRKVENELNRGWAYKLGYVNAWKTDRAMGPRLQKQFEYKEYSKNNRLDLDKIKLDKETKVKDSILGETTVFEQKFDMFKQKRAQNAARDIVRLIHFDYSGAQKAPILRTKTGAVLGQFQHYGMNLFVLQKKWIQEGFGDVSRGDLFGEKANRMHRLFFMNTMVHGIFSPLFNTDLGNLIQNDTVDRANKWWTLWSEDDDEKRAQAFFNKGPVAGSLGPTVSTALDVKNLVDETFDLGEIFAWYDDFDDDGIMSYMTGREYAAERDEDLGTFGTLLNLFNIQLGRLYNSTGPKMLQSRNPFGTLFTSELGLYPSDYTRNVRESVPMLNPKTWNVKTEAPTVMNFDANVMKSLDALEQE